MAATRVQITVDCHDPGLLARFWAVALNYDFPPPPGGHATWREAYLAMGVPEEELGDGDPVDRVVDPDGVGPAMWFQEVPEDKAVKNRLHLDLLVGGGRSFALAERRVRVDAEVARLLAAGASVAYPLDGSGVDHYAVVMRDPEGNEFCVV